MKKLIVPFICILLLVACNKQNVSSVSLISSSNGVSSIAPASSTIIVEQSSSIVTSSATVKVTPPVVVQQPEKPTVNQDKIKALQVESDRHTNQLVTISTQYDQQITDLQNAIQNFILLGAKDTTADIAKSELAYASALEYYNSMYKQYGNILTTQTAGSIASYDGIALDKLKKTKKDYDQMVIDQTQLTTFKADKNNDISQEDVTHSTNLAEIQVTYS
jgi:hypothetical protein